MTKNSVPEQEELIQTCLHEIGHAIAYAKQGHKLKGVTVDLTRLDESKPMGTCMPDYPPMAVLNLVELNGYELADFYNLDRAKSLPNTIRQSDLTVYREAVEDCLAIYLAGAVSEVFLYGVFYDKPVACSETKLISLIKKMTNERIDVVCSDGPRSTEFAWDEVLIAFFLQAHTSKGIYSKMIKRVLNELRCEAVTAIVKTMVPKLSTKGRLSKADLRAIESAFQPA